MIIHYRQFLVALIFADLPSLSLSFQEILVPLIFLSGSEPRVSGRTKNANACIHYIRAPAE